MGWGRAACLLALAGCQAVDVPLAGRPCGDDGACGVELECHPENRRCAPAVPRGCQAQAELCAWRVETGDSCSWPGGFLPCVPGREDCFAGCRTCQEDGIWSACSPATCELGQVWSCDRCDDDCRLVVHGAEPRCQASGTQFVCVYEGSCWGDAVDADGVSGNGCECGPTGSVELCNGVDEQCNGEVDEGFELGESCGVGVCAGGVRECDPGQPAAARCSTMSMGSEDRSAEDICNGLDDDCDGAPDNGFACVGGTEQACDVGSGLDSGRQTCTAPGCTFGPCLPHWWDDRYARRLIIDLNTDLLVETLSHFPLLVRLTPDRFDYDACLSGGLDLQFVAMDGSTQLRHEVDTWLPGAESSVWVEVPELGIDAPTFIVLYYGATADSGAQQPAGVWDPYRAVWHLDEEAAGRDTAGLYVDATGNGFAGDDLVEVNAKTGYVGAGQGLAQSGDSVRVTNPTPLVSPDAFTLEAWVRSGSPSWTHVIPVTLSMPTDRADSQIIVTLTPGGFDYGLSQANGVDLRFFDAQGRVVPHWRSSWNPGGDSSIWVRVPQAGTTGLRLLVGLAGAAEVSDPAAVFDFWWNFADGVPATVWSVASIDYTTANGFLTLRKGGVSIASPFAFDLRNNYIVTVRARFEDSSLLFSGTVPLVASSRFIADFNANSDVLAMMARQSTNLYAWLASGSSAAFDQYNMAYLSAPATGSWLGFSTVLQPTRVDFWEESNLRASRNPATLGRAMHFLSLGSPVADTGYDIQDTSYAWVLVRKVAAWPSATLGTPTAAGLSVPGSFGLGLGSGGVQASVGGTRLSGAAGAGWHHLALVYGQAEAVLYVDGEPQARGGASITLGNLWPLLLGEGAALSGWIDEVRLSASAFSAGYLRAQFDSMSGALVSYRTIEQRP